jgi:hypothetical protein
MKKVKMVQIFFLLICLIGYTISSAQSDYVVTIKGDTILGKVKYLNYGNEKKVQVVNDKKTVFSILQTSAFKMDNEVYHTVRTSQGYTYMKIIKGGYLSLYAFQQPNQMSWDGSLLLKRDGSDMEVPNIGFKKNMKKFLIECPDVVDRIESGELSKSKITEIVDAYNQCIDLNTKNQNMASQTPKVIEPSKEATDKLSAWIQLETDVKNLTNFEGSKDALEMIQEIKSKISKGEKIPNFLSEGLKETLKDQSSIQVALEKALQEIKN